MITWFVSFNQRSPLSNFCNMINFIITTISLLRICEIYNLKNSWKSRSKISRNKLFKFCSSEIIKLWASIIKLKQFLLISFILNFSASIKGSWGKRVDYSTSSWKSRTKLSLFGFSMRVRHYHWNEFPRHIREREVPCIEISGIALKIVVASILQIYSWPILLFRPVIVIASTIQDKVISGKRLWSLESEEKRKGMKLRLAYVSHYAPLRYIRKRIYIYCIYIYVYAHIYNRTDLCVYMCEYITI